MRPLRLFLIGLVLVSACTGQTPPSRQPLPSVGEVVEEALPCGFLLGEGLGVSIEDVISGGAADGVLESGDLLVGLDGATVANADQLRAVLAEKAVGDEVALDVKRGEDDIALEVTLGANPDDPARPLLGVMIETAFERVPAPELTGQLEGSPLTRAVEIGGDLYVLDPQTAAWGSLEVEAPTGPWAAVAGGIFVVEQADSAESSLFDVVSRDRILFEAGDWRASRILGSIGNQIVVSASRPVEGDEGLFELAIMLIDLEARNARWIWVIDDFDLGLPVVTFPSPDGTRILVAGQGQEDEIIRYLVIGVDSIVQQRPADLTSAEDLIAVGWLDNRQVLMRTRDGALQLLEPATGLVTPMEMPATVGSVSRVWAVGDGELLLADTGSALVRFRSSGDSEVRILADNCEVGLIGDIGWRPEPAQS